LRAKQNWKSLTSLSEELIERHFGKPELLIHLAEARFLSGRVDEGISILRQARFFDRSLESQALSMLDNYGFSSIEEESIGGEDDRKEKIHFKNCVLVEPDQIAARSVEETLKSIGISDIQIFSDGESAWDWLKTNPEPQLLVQEWRIPKLSGPALLQRVRSHGHLNTVVIVLSSLVKASDAPLLSEMSVANCFAKPVVPNDFINTLVWTSVQERLPTDAKAIERKLLTLLRTGQISAAKSLKATYFSLPDTSEGERKYIDAEILYYDGKFNEAKTKAVESIRLIGKGSLAPLNLLAKCLLRQKDFKSAFRILEQARKMSPENLGRILDLAELNLHNGDANAAMELVADARRIDSTNSRIDSIEVRGSIAQGKPSRALSLMRSMSSLVEVVSYMNNRAVALAQTGHMKEALDVYRNTLQAVPDDRKSTKTIVGYNLGLCLCRSGDVAGGIEVLEKVAAEIAEPMAERASSLVERLRRAVATGTKVQFSSSLQSSLDGENDITIDFESINKDSVKESAPERETESFVNPICLAGIFRLQ
jgi:tetratricopeptide (TPR) repeat protein